MTTTRKKVQFSGRERLKEKRKWAKEKREERKEATRMCSIRAYRMKGTYRDKFNWTTDIRKAQFYWEEMRHFVQNWRRFGHNVEVCTILLGGNATFCPKLARIWTQCRNMYLKIEKKLCTWIGPLKLGSRPF